MYGKLFPNRWLFGRKTFERLHRLLMETGYFFTFWSEAGRAKLDGALFVVKISLYKVDDQPNKITRIVTRDLRVSYSTTPQIQ